MDIVFDLAELFSGPGGLALGATQASVSLNDTTYKVRSVWANDIDENTCKTYSKNLHSFQKGKVVNTPIQDLNFADIPHFDALAFGFPCNDFSLVGEQKGFDGKYGPLYSYGIKAIESHNPKWFIAENVSGLRSANDGKALFKILDELENAGLGYRVTPHLYKFEEYGVPQRRHRIVIIGIRSDLGLEFKVPAPTTKDNPLTAKEALESPPIPSTATNNEKKKLSSRVTERLSYIPPGGNAWNDEIPEILRLNVKGAKLSNIYKRLHPNKPSYTVTGSGGGGTHVYHWEELRSLTNRERARLQSFPDDFIFEGTAESIRKQIGMAVPPTAAKQIIEAVLKTFAKIDYKYVEPNLLKVNAIKLT
jgi:DNA (cytosine-5)-methyltransferase 1